MTYCSPKAVKMLASQELFSIKLAYFILGIPPNPHHMVQYLPA